MSVPTWHRPGGEIVLPHTADHWGPDDLRLGGWPGMCMWGGGEVVLIRPGPFHIGNYVNDRFFRGALSDIPFHRSVLSGRVNDLYIILTMIIPPQGRHCRGGVSSPLLTRFACRSLPDTFHQFHVGYTEWFGCSIQGSCKQWSYGAEEASLSQSWTICAWSGWGSHLHCLWEEYFSLYPKTIFLFLRTQTI